MVEASRELLAEICRFYGSEEGVMLLFSRKGRVAVWNQRREEYQVLEKKPISEKTIACWEKILSKMCIRDRHKNKRRLRKIRLYDLLYYDCLLYTSSFREEIR